MLHVGAVRGLPLSAVDIAGWAALTAFAGRECPRPDCAIAGLDLPGR